MSAVSSTEQTGRRVEEILDRLAESGDPAAAAAAEELVRSLMDFYGAGLARILQLLSGAPGEAAARPLGDALVARVRESGAEVIQEPTDMPYGVRDCAFRDPAGNMLRFMESSGD